MTKAVLYLIMRNDLPSLNPGKLAAQAAHCANAAVAEARRLRNPLLKAWEQQTRQHFGTTIVLGGSFDTISALRRAHPVWDPSYPCEIPLEVALALEKVSDHRRDWSVMALSKRGLFLRRELVGAYVLAAERPAELEGLELYP